MSSKSLIPKVIHKIWHNFDGSKEGESPPEDLINKHTICSAMNSDYQIKFWTEEMSEKLMIEKFPEYYSLYRNYKYPIQRVDILKYFILFNEGGIYTDMDIGCLKPFGNYFNESKVYIVEDSCSLSPYKFNNFLIASPARNPFWLKVFEELLLCNKEDILYNVYILESTGPGLLQRAYEKYVSEFGDSNFEILKKENFNPYDICGQNTDLNDAYIIHESTLSWSKGSRLLVILFCNYGVILIYVMILLLIWCLLIFN